MGVHRHSIVAAHVGATADPVNTQHRVCHRCGVQRSINGRTDRSKPFMCGDCKLVDPAMAKRLGLRS